MLGLGRGHHRPAGAGNEGLLPNRNKNTTPFMGRGYLGQHPSFTRTLSPGNWPPLGSSSVFPRPYFPYLHVREGQ